ADRDDRGVAVQRQRPTLLQPDALGRRQSVFEFGEDLLPAGAQRSWLGDHATTAPVPCGAGVARTPLAVSKPRLSGLRGCTSYLVGRRPARCGGRGGGAVRAVHCTECAVLCTTSST